MCLTIVNFLIRVGKPIPPPPYPISIAPERQTLMYTEQFIKDWSTKQIDSSDLNILETQILFLVRYYDKRDAEDAVDALNGRQYDGRELRVSVDAGRPGGNSRSA